MESSATYANMSDKGGTAAVTPAPLRSSATELLRSSSHQRASHAHNSSSASSSSSSVDSRPHSLASSTASSSSSRGDESLLAGYSTHGELEADFAAERPRAASASAAANAASSSTSQPAGNTRRHTDDGLAALAGPSSSSGAYLDTADPDPSAGFGGEILFDDGVGGAAAAADGGSHGGGSSSGVAAIDWLARCMRRCSCSPRDIRVLLMLLPLTTVVLFATNQKTAAFVLLGFTVVVGAALLARIVQIIGARRRRRQQYGFLDPAAGEEAAGNGEIAMVSLGDALGLSSANSSSSGSGRSRSGQSRSGARYHSSLLHPAARHNPTALRLAMADRDFGPNDYDLLLRLDSEHQAQVFTGIPASQIQRLPTWRVPKAAAGATASKENVCAVCLEDKAEGEMVRTLPCLHTFHVACIDPWLQSHVKCPVCQYKVVFPD